MSSWRHEDDLENPVITIPKKLYFTTSKSVNFEYEKYGTAAVGWL